MLNLTAIVYESYNNIINSVHSHTKGFPCSRIMLKQWNEGVVSANYAFAYPITYNKGFFKRREYFTWHFTFYHVNLVLVDSISINFRPSVIIITFIILHLDFFDSVPYC